MVENEKQREPIPENFDTIEEFWEFWDNHSLADYEDKLKEVHFEVDIESSSDYFAVERGLAKKIGEIAKTRGVSSETLVNLWLQEMIAVAV